MKRSATFSNDIWIERICLENYIWPGNQQHCHKILNSYKGQPRLRVEIPSFQDWQSKLTTKN